MYIFFQMEMYKNDVKVVLLYVLHPFNVKTDKITPEISIFFSNTLRYTNKLQ